MRRNKAILFYSILFYPAITFYRACVLFKVGRGRPLSLKGLGHELNIFWEVYKGNLELFCTCAYGLHIFILLWKRKLNTKFLLAFMKTFTNYENYKKPHQNFCSSFPSLSWLIFSGDKSKAAFSTVFRVTSCFRNNFWSYRRLSICRNELFERGFWTDFLN